MKLLVLTSLLIGLWAGAAGAARAQDIYVVNESSLPQAQVVDALPAFQTALDRDFSRYWNATATLRLDTPPAGAWIIYLDDASSTEIPWNAAGFHSTDGFDTPYARVGVDEGPGFNWQMVFTHELFEMLADPYVDRATYVAQCGAYSCTSSRVWMLEVADPVERQHYCYNVPSATGVPVIISDFVTERWYDGHRGRTDFLGWTKRPHQVLQGGYASFLESGIWRLVFADGRTANAFWR